MIRVLHKDGTIRIVGNETRNKHLKNIEKKADKLGLRLTYKGPVQDKGYRRTDGSSMDKQELMFFEFKRK